MRFSNKFLLFFFFLLYSQCTTIGDFAFEWPMALQLYQLEK